MKARKTALALLLLFSSISPLWENKAKVIGAVTKEENLVFDQSTNLKNEEMKDNYILLNIQKDKNTKEYLNAFFTYEEDGIYIDDTDRIPMEFFQNKEGYLSLGLQLEKSQAIQCKSASIGVLDIGLIHLTLTDEPIYWRAVNEKGAYEITGEELKDSEYIKKLLPESIEGLKGYLTVLEGKNQYLSEKIDFVPANLNNTESIFNIRDSIDISALLYNRRLYRYLEESQDAAAVLMVTANYHFKVTLPYDAITRRLDCPGTIGGPKDYTIEGNITLTKTYKMNK